MRYLVFALLTVAASSVSGAQLLVSSQPAPGSAGNMGMTSYTFSLLTEGSESFRGVDASFNGTMSQNNPFGLVSIFMDANNVMPATGILVGEDSQFLFHSSTVLSIGAEEGPNILKAAISGLADNGLPNPAPFARVVAFSNALSGVLSFDIGLPTPYTVAFSGVPEPTSCVLASLALVGSVARRRV